MYLLNDLFNSLHIENKHVTKERHRPLSADSSYSTASSIGYDSDELSKNAKILSRNRPKTGDHYTRLKREKSMHDKKTRKDGKNIIIKQDAAQTRSATGYSLKPQSIPDYGDASVNSIPTTQVRTQ